jgi:flavin reductase (DIM6/NTAB) family NADH-FMN oxidoreductase RutF
MKLAIILYRSILWLYLLTTFGSYFAAGSKNGGNSNQHVRASHSMTLPTAFCASPQSTPATSTRSSSSPIPPPPPLSMPVWSLACPAIALSPPPTTAENNDTNNESPAGTPPLPPTTSMNIVTFATAVSVAAPKLWAVSLYHNTLTKDSFLASGTGVLQLLSATVSNNNNSIESHQKYLVPVLGKRSGYEYTTTPTTTAGSSYYSKKDESAKLGFGWIRSSHGSDFRCSADLELLPECCTYISLKLLQTVPAGDHVVALCEVVDTGVWDPSTRTVPSCGDNRDAPNQVFDPSSALYTGQLRQEGII